MTKVYSKTDKYGNTSWYKEGTNIRHREDGPAVEFSNGDKCWYQNGKLHRLDGPAEEYADGDKYWYQHGIFHRQDGPAIIRADGYKEYWLDGNRYLNIKTDEEWIIFQIIN